MGFGGLRSPKTDEVYPTKIEKNIIGLGTFSNQYLLFIHVRRSSNDNDKLNCTDSD